MALTTFAAARPAYRDAILAVIDQSIMRLPLDQIFAKLQSAHQMDLYANVVRYAMYTLHPDPARAAEIWAAFDSYTRDELYYRVADDLRYHHRRVYGWTPIDEESMIAMRQFIGRDSAVSVGAGTALRDAILHLMGVDIVATDPAYSSEPISYACHMPESRMCALDGLRAVRRFRRNVLISVWPHMMDDWISATLAAFTGSKFILIGESIGGCTDTPFLDSDAGDRTWKLVKLIPHANFRHVSSKIFCYVRRRTRSQKIRAALRRGRKQHRRGM